MRRCCSPIYVYTQRMILHCLIYLLCIIKTTFPASSYIKQCVVAGLVSSINFKTLYEIPLTPLHIFLSLSTSHSLSLSCCLGLRKTNEDMTYLHVKQVFVISALSLHTFFILYTHYEMTLPLVILLYLFKTF